MNHQNTSILCARSERHLNNITRSLCAWWLLKMNWQFKCKTTHIVAAVFVLSANKSNQMKKLKIFQRFRYPVFYALQRRMHHYIATKDWKKFSNLILTASYSLPSTKCCAQVFEKTLSFFAGLIKSVKRPSNVVMHCVTMSCILWERENVLLYFCFQAHREESG